MRNILCLFYSNINHIYIYKYIYICKLYMHPIYTMSNTTPPMHTQTTSLMFFRLPKLSPAKGQRCGTGKSESFVNLEFWVNSLPKTILDIYLCGTLMRIMYKYMYIMLCTNNVYTCKYTCIYIIYNLCIWTYIYILYIRCFFIYPCMGKFGNYIQTLLISYIKSRNKDKSIYHFTGLPKNL